MGCHFLLQCMKVKSESEVTQSCPTLCDPVDCSPPGSSVHGIFQARVLEWGAIAFSLLTCLHFFRRSLISLIWRGSRKEFLPALNSYRISGFSQQFATDHSPSCRVNLWYLAFHFPLTRLRPALFSPQTTLGTLIGSRAGLAKTCFPTILCPYHPVLLLLLCPHLRNKCMPPSDEQIYWREGVESCRSQLPGSTPFEWPPGPWLWEGRLP